MFALKVIDLSSVCYKHWAGEQGVLNAMTETYVKGELELVCQAAVGGVGGVAHVDVPPLDLCLNLVWLQLSEVFWAFSKSFWKIFEIFFRIISLERLE